MKILEQEFDESGVTGKMSLTKLGSERSSHPSTIGLKLNLYSALDVEALAQVIDTISPSLPVECLMVGDSYFATHLGLQSTRLTSKVEEVLGLQVMADRITEVRRAIDKYLPKYSDRLIGDLPDGAAHSGDVGFSCAKKLLDAGASFVKIETANEDGFATLDYLSKRGIPALAHLGYTPQKGRLRRYGDTVEEAKSIFSMARRVRDCGAQAISLEMVSEAVNCSLSRQNRADSLPIYSIFSGWVPHGGQSLNVWDSVVLPEHPSSAFPPTARYKRTDLLGFYTIDTVVRCLSELIEITLKSEFPRTPVTRMSKPDQEKILNIDPWKSYE